MTSIEAVLPATVQIQNFAGDIILVGPNLDTEVYKIIMSGFPESAKGKLIGWKKIGRLQTQRERRP